MKKALVFGFGLIALIGLSGCGKKAADINPADIKDADGLAEAELKLGEEMYDLLKGVTDKASAEKAKPEIEKLAKKAVEFKKRQEELKISADDYKKAKDKLKDKFDEQEKKGKELMEKMNKEASEVVGEAFKGAGK